ncbi:MAG: hypothetical protein ABW185_28790 [Sedimenticola sp.]
MAANTDISLSESKAYVDTVMGSQQISVVIGADEGRGTTNTSESAKQSIMGMSRQGNNRKRALSSGNGDDDRTVDTLKKKRTGDDNSDMEIIRQMRIMTNEMKDTFESRFDKLEDKLRNEFVNMVKGQIHAVRQEFNNRVDSLSKKIEEKLTARATDLIETKVSAVRKDVKNDMQRLSGTVDYARQSFAEAAARAPSRSPENLNVVIRNMECDPREEHDTVITKDKVKALIRDGMKINDITIKSVCRKKDLSNNRPGVIIATVDTAAQKAKIMKNKSSLRQCRNFRNVYIEDDRPLEVRTNEANIKTLLTEMGKSDKYININGRYVMKRSNNGNTNDESNTVRNGNNNDNNRNRNYPRDNARDNGTHGNRNYNNYNRQRTDTNRAR